MNPVVLSPLSAEAAAAAAVNGGSLPPTSTTSSSSNSSRCHRCTRAVVPISPPPAAATTTAARREKRQRYPNENSSSSNDCQLLQPQQQQQGVQHSAARTTLGLLLLLCLAAITGMTVVWEAGDKSLSFRQGSTTTTTTTTIPIHRARQKRQRRQQKQHQLLLQQGQRQGQRHQQQLNSSNVKLRVSSHAQTSMEQVFNRAFNYLISTGEWASSFGKSADLASANTCSGAYQDWPLPNISDPLEHESDLYNLLLLHQEQQQESQQQQQQNESVFQCGFLAGLQYETVDGKILIDSTDGSNVTGLVPDFWKRLVQVVQDMLQKDSTIPIPTLSLAWKVYPTAQEGLLALENGDIHAACGYWAPDGEYITQNGTSIARALVFSIQTCPMLLQQTYIYTIVANNNLTSWQDLYRYLKLHSNAHSKICVASLPGSGVETSCQNTVEQYLGSDTTIRCQGVLNATTTDIFAFLLSGDCIALWNANWPSPKYNLTVIVSGQDGAAATPDEIAAADLYAFPQPTVQARVSLFRSVDLKYRNATSTAKMSSSSSSPVFSANESSVLTALKDTEPVLAARLSRLYPERTSLEQAITAAWNSLIASGDFVDAFGNITNVASSTYCTGGQGWTVPQVEAGSDLDYVLSTGIFRCGYPYNKFFTTSSRQPVTLIQTFPNNYTAVTGLVPDYWRTKVIPKLGEMYKKQLVLEERLLESTLDTFIALEAGGIDAACGYWSPDGTYRLYLDAHNKILAGAANNQTAIQMAASTATVARPFVFSNMLCPVFLQTDNIYTLAGSNIRTFGELVQEAKAGTVHHICVADDTTGGTVVTCQSTIDQYAPESNVICMGAESGSDQSGTGLSAQAFARLYDNYCQAVWSGVPPSKTVSGTNVEYWAFPRPAMTAMVSFFRIADLAGPRPTIPIPTLAPTSFPARMKTDAPTLKSGAAVPASGLQVSLVCLLIGSLLCWLLV